MVMLRRLFCNYRPFKNKANSELTTLLAISQLCRYPRIVRNLEWALNASKRILGEEKTSYMIKKSAGRIYSGGETKEELLAKIQFLKKEGKGSIIGYGAELQQSNEAFEEIANITIESAEYLSSTPDIIIGVKLTGLVSTSLLSKLSSIQSSIGSPFKNPLFEYTNLKEHLSSEEQSELNKTNERVQRVISKLVDLKFKILISAEHTSYQKAIDAWTYALQKQFNKKEGIVSSTFQCYLTDSYNRLNEYVSQSRQEGYPFSVKLVRGSYFNEERPLGTVFSTKKDTNRSYNSSLEFLMSSMTNNDHLVLASQNEESIELGKKLIGKYSILKKNVVFAQLLGLSDLVTAKLVEEGYCTYKYMPYGPTNKLFLYLIRRAIEQSDLAEMASEQIKLIKEELKIRYNK